MSYLLGRLAAFPVVMLGVSLLVFVALRLVPGDAITAMLGTEAGLLTPDQREALGAYFGLDQSWLTQYRRWAKGIATGDLGVSVTYGKPVLDVILSRFPLTLELALLSMAAALTTGLPLGIWAAVRQGGRADLVVRIFSVVGQSTPGYVLGLLVIYGLSAALGAAPAMGGAIAFFEDPISALARLALPASALGLSFSAAVIRTARGAMLDVLRDDYVRTARSKGASRARAVWRHALPNALIPIVTVSGVEFGYLLGGAVLIEQVFALPGLGRLILDAILQRDYALVQGSVLFLAVNFMVVNLLADLVCGLLDPRIRLGGDG
jgi:peptide/nickel transport system permease protein